MMDRRPDASLLDSCNCLLHLPRAVVAEPIAPVTDAIPARSVFIAPVNMPVLDDALVAAAAAVAALAAWLAFASARDCAADVACVIFVATWDKFVVKFTRFEPLWDVIWFNALDAPIALDWIIFVAFEMDVAA